MTDERKANRRMVGFALLGSTVIMTAVAVLILIGVITFSEETRVLAGSLVAVVAVLDALMAVYFIVSDPS